jgi:hypothetical protein
LGLKINVFPWAIFPLTVHELERICESVIPIFLLLANNLPFGILDQSKKKNFRNVAIQDLKGISIDWLIAKGT